MSNQKSSGNPLSPPESANNNKNNDNNDNRNKQAPSAAATDGKTEPAKAEMVEAKLRPEDGVVARRPPPRHVQRHAANLATLNNRRGLLKLSPMEQRIAMGTGKVAISIADGLLFSSSRIINPTISAALAVYGLVNIVQDYRHGALNRLGYRTSSTDVALRIGKEVGTMAIGFGIGTGVGALIGLSSIPVVGQLVLATVLSAVLGLCVGTLITRYVDRLFVRMQIRSQYKYPADEKGARRRFEELIAERHDLCNLDTCRVVQHYADYRVSSGWESPNDIDDYRNSGGDTRFMPVSFQHFAIIQLERKWGFLRQRAACRKVFKALMLTHHPDRGGSANMAAQLKNDYEVYAFCNKWLEDCPSLLGADVDPEVNVPFEQQQQNTRRRNPVRDFLRSLFRPATNSAMDAEDLHQFGLLTQDGEVTATTDHLGQLNDELAKAEGSTADNDDDNDNNSNNQVNDRRDKLNFAIQQHSITRVLNALQQTYQGVAEIVTFAGLIRVYEQPSAWEELKTHVQLFNRMQSYVRVTIAMRQANATHCAPAQKEHRCCGFTWSNLPQAVEKREAMRKAIIAAVFTEQTNRQLEYAMDLCRSGKQITENYFKQCGERADTTTQGASNILDTLMRIQQKLEELGQAEQAPWKDKVQAWVTQTSSPSSALTLMDEIKNVGVTASTALAGEHARDVHANVTEFCENYFRGWKKMHHTLVVMEDELQDVEGDVEHMSSQVAAAAANRKDASREKEQDVLVQRAQDYNVKILLLQKQAAEVDQRLQELYDICLYYFPEYAHQVDHLPSTCAMCIDETAYLPRWIRFERERTSACYSHVELEVQGPIDAARCVQYNTDHALYRFDLLQATYTNPMDGTMVSCWLKRYTFQPAADDADEEERRAHRKAQVDQVGQMLRYELRTAKACRSDLILSPTDVFYDVRMQEVYFHLPRDSTQQRFGSTHDVQRRILPKGVQWLNDALQCLIDLHYSRTAHGNLSLSSFTYDEFGKTMLGFFVPLPTESQAHEEAVYLGGGGGDDGSSVATNTSMRAAREKDVIDFVELLVSEVIPYLGPAAAAPTSSPTAKQQPAAPSAGSVTPPPPSYETKQQDTVRIFTEVADRLMGKIEPRWSLVDARSFVRRCLQFDFETAERQYLFSKEVTYPVSWAFYRVTTPIVVTAEHRMHLKVSRTKRCQLFLNKNLSLWTTYWRCRRKMTLKRMGSFPQPQVVRQKKQLLPCSDDCEVNERYMWFPCRDEEEVWSLCLNGFFLLSGDAFASLRFRVPEEEGAWGVVCRVAVGTVLNADSDEGGGLSPRSAKEAQESILSHAAVRRCHLSEDAEALLVPSPWARCYPEFIAQLFDKKEKSDA